MSTKQNLLDLINKNYTEGSSLNINDFVEEAQKNNAAKLQADIDVINTGYDSQISNTQKFYDKEIEDTKTSYENQYTKNSVQNEINKMKIEQSMASLGLTDSGLNRTQQTAAQLSYANQKGDIDLARQSKLDELSLKLTDAITTLENNKASDIRKTENYWNDLSYNQGVSAYNDKLNYHNDQIKGYTEELADIIEAENNAAAEVQKALISVRGNTENNSDFSSLISGNTISRDYTGTLEDNGIRWARFTDSNGDDKVKYVDSTTGDMVIMDWGQNPYTLDRNLDENNNSATALAAKYFGVYSHGYQPKGLCVFENGVAKYYGFESAKSEYIQVLGRYQNVFSANGKKWIWNDAGNKYVECIIENGEVIAPDWVN